MDDQSPINHTTAIVAAYVAHNSVAATDLPAFIASVHAALLATSGKAEPALITIKMPAVAIRRSIQPDFLVCLEDGRKFKSLKRHLRTKYALSPDAYRAKWGLPREYPMVAPNYSAARSQLAKAIGLGVSGHQAARAAKRSTRAKAPA